MVSSGWVMAYSGVRGWFGIVFSLISLLGVGIFWPLHSDKWTAAAARTDSSQSPFCAGVCARGEQGLRVPVSMGPGYVWVLLHTTSTVRQDAGGGDGQRGPRSVAPGQAAQGGRTPSSRGCQASASVGTRRTGGANARAAVSWECRKRSYYSCSTVGDTFQRLEGRCSGNTESAVILYKLFKHAT